MTCAETAPPVAILTFEAYASACAAISTVLLLFLTHPPNLVFTQLLYELGSGWLAVARIGTSAQMLLTDFAAAETILSAPHTKWFGKNSGVNLRRKA